ncbi:neutral amino acid permease [Aureobasidium subglaciale]|nr:neutral amino acid permease [Aureobasidium subglaciale]
MSDIPVEQKQPSSDLEKDFIGAPLAQSASVRAGKVEEIHDDDEFEVFKRGEGDVDFRTVGWIRASVIFLKIIFATGVLAIPSAYASLGALPGALNVLGWCALNTYTGVILGNFRNRHAGCHSVADMAGVIGGPILREGAGLLFAAAYVICAASGIIGSTAALNALSEHAICTMWFAFIVTIVVAAMASARKFETMSYFTWAGFISVFVAVFIVVVGVAVRDRPAAAPRTGDFDLGYHVIGHPSFAGGITAAANIFSSSAGTSAMLPVISEMKNPKDYKKALYLCMGFVTSAYLAFSLVVYAYCGEWIVSPSLGSAGPLIKKISYGIGLLGLLVTPALYTHCAAKYCFVRILRNSQHLQRSTFVHFATWLGCTVVLSAIALILAAAIPIFDYIIALAGSVCFAPLAIMLPACLWMYDFMEFRRGTLLEKGAFYAHGAMFILGVFMMVGGTYGTVASIVDAYAQGTVGSAFSCADNSGSSG